MKKKFSATEILIFYTGLFLIISTIALFFIFFEKSEEKELSFFLTPLMHSRSENFLLWDTLLDNKMTLQEYCVLPKQNLASILKSNRLKLEETLNKSVFKKKSRASTLLKNLRPENKIAFIVSNIDHDHFGIVSQFILETDNEEFYFKENKIIRSSERAIVQPEVQYRSLHLLLKNSIFKDLTQAGVPSQLIQLIADILSQRIDLKKDIKKNSELSLLYSLDPKGKYSLYRFSFDNHQKKITGYYFPTKSCNFFDQDGCCFKKTFLDCPVESAYISSHFSEARVHPVLGVIRAHKGVDFAAKKGTPIKAVADGTITYIGVKGGYGNILEIEHGQLIKTVYAHLDCFAKNLAKGSLVKQGQIIGYVGMTGLATGPHLHYELHLKGIPVDPLRAVIPKNQPLSDIQLIELKKNIVKIEDLNKKVDLDK